jgi:hypothetical protein
MIECPKVEGKKIRKARNYTKPWRLTYKMGFKSYFSKKEMPFFEVKTLKKGQDTEGV